MTKECSPAADENVRTENLISLTADIVAAHVSNNSVSAEQIADLISNVHQALAGLGKEQKEDTQPEPAVSIRSSVKKDYIICLEDGKKMKMLKRHLMTDHGMTPDEYRARWGLPSDYPMVAPDYAEKRRDLAKKIGLGRKPGQKRGRKPGQKAQAKSSAAPRKTAGTGSRSTKQ
ncbi:MucR family transcriptional regulator [Pelagerythrobacter marinus]|uniref:MucR family transcriptional regulator n=1 Tax=Pelagerythrobacter marinus TaxID=538382 RepID=UPI002AC9C676|nr:MucR family transcriptional regulator [Pelagerythrobacter marinus]WPZ07586.1 MucR family transcriptional regulator [Pelagerythrobacter marinus]